MILIDMPTFSSIQCPLISFHYIFYNPPDIFFNSLVYQSNSGNLIIEISDHFIQFLIWKAILKKKTVPEFNIMKRDFRNFNDREFKETLDNINSNQIFDVEMNDPNLSCKTFINGIVYLLDEFVELI